VCHVTVCVSGRLEARVAASRRILALAKRRDDVGHRLKLFESGDEERRSSGAGVQLQVRAAIYHFYGFFSHRIARQHAVSLSLTRLCHRLQEERLRRTLQRELPRITDELRALLEQVCWPCCLDIAHTRRALDSFAESHSHLMLHRSGKQARGRASYSTACHFCMT
jgi:hypothetical protein